MTATERAKRNQRAAAARIARKARKPHTYEVQVGKGKGSYKPKYTFTETGVHSSRAWLWYSGINVHSGGKKRLLRDGKVIARELT